MSTVNFCDANGFGNTAVDILLRSIKDLARVPLLIFSYLR